MVVAGLAPAMPDCTLSFIRQQSLPGGILWWSQLYCLSGSPAHVVLLANLIKKASVSVVATIQSSLARTSYHVWSRWVQIAPSASFESRLSSSTGSAEEPLDGLAPVDRTQSLASLLVRERKSLKP